MANTKVTRILTRNGTKLEWELARNPKLEAGEIGIENDTYRMKIGTSDTPQGWDTVEYFAAGIVKVQGVDSVNANGLEVDDEGTLKLDVDSILADLEDKVNRSGDVMTGGLFTPVIEANVGAIYGGLSVDSNSAFLDGLEVHGLFTAHQNSSVGGALDVGQGINARSGKLNDFDPAVHNPGEVYPFMAVDDEDIITLAYLRDSLDGIASYDDSIIALTDSITALQDSVGEIEDSIDTLNDKVDSVDGIAKGALLLAQQNTGSIIGLETDIINLETNLQGQIDVHTNDISLILDANRDQWDSILAFDDSINQLFDTVGGFNDTIAYLMDDKVRQDILLAGQRQDIDSLSSRVDSINSVASGALLLAQQNTSSIIGVETDLSNLETNLQSQIDVHTNDISLILDANRDQWDSILAFDDSINYHDSVLSYHNGLLASLNGEIDGHTVRLDNLEDSVDSINSVSKGALLLAQQNTGSIIGVETDLANLETNLQGQIDVHTNDISLILDANRDQWDSILAFDDSIKHHDTVFLTEDSIPNALNRDWATNRADGGKLTKIKDPSGKYKYTYTPSLPIRQIAKDVVDSIGTVDSVNAIDAVIMLFDLIQNQYDPNVTFSADDYDT